MREKLAALMEGRPESLVEDALKMWEWITGLYPGATQLIYDGYAVSIVFSHSSKMNDGFVHIAVYAKHMNVGFNQGAFLDDPDGLLEGTGKAIRHVKFRDWDSFPEKAVEDLLSQAVGEPVPKDGSVIWKVKKT